MSGDLILADFKTKTWIADRKRQELDLQQQGVALILTALQGAPVPLGQEPTIYIDSGPSEMNPDQTA